MKRTNLKRAFLLSVLSLLLCVSMFVGTTFAWFSETISNQNNRIMAGNLDVELYYKLNAGDAWTELTSTSELFDDEALWEPGYTQVVYFKVENKGTLALKYQFGVNIISETEGTNVAGDPFKLSDYIEFGVIETADETTYATRELARAAVTSSKIISEGFTKSSELLAAVGTTPSDEFVTMVVYMPETVENEANYKTGTTPPQINLGIELYATQMMNEEDTFGPDYDKDAQLPASKTESVVAGSDTVINTENGSVTVPAGATTAEELTFSIAPTTAPGTITVAAGETLTAYEVTLVDENGDKVTTTADVEASIYIGKGLNVTKLYHNTTEIAFDYNTVTGYITFNTDSFSPFTVVTKAAADLEEITTANALVAAAAKGGAYKLGADIQLSSALVVSKGFTLYGNNKTLTSTATRAINVSGANGVVIKDLIINASGERAVNVIQNATNVVLDNVTATAANYAVNVASSAPAAVLTVKNSTINGLNAVNVASAGANVTITDSTINCNDENTTAGEVYAALCLNKDAVGASIIATNTTVNVTAGSDSEKGRNGAEDGTVTINGSTEGVTVTVAVITYPGSDYYYGFKTLAEAIEFAKAGDTITLIRDITLTETVVIPAGKTVTLDLNGKTISQTKECTASYSMIENNGTLTITGNGKLSFNDTGAGDPNVGWATYTLRNAGTLTVENGTIEHLGTQAYNGNNAIFHYSGTTVINGGVISAAYSRSLRQWNGSVTINGGEFDGQVWVQAMNDCSFTVNGGSFKPATYGNDGSSIFVTNNTKNVTVSVTGGDFATKFGCSDAAKIAGCITGGNFTESAKANTNAALFAN